MNISIFDMFKVGIGPSSSHTMGPMAAACEFLERQQNLYAIGKLECHLYASLALTGVGHGTHKALMLGLKGLKADQINPKDIKPYLQNIKDNHSIDLLGQHCIPFDSKQDIIFHRFESLPHHPNGMIFKAFAKDGRLLAEETYYSFGGGFIATEKELSEKKQHQEVNQSFPLSFSTGKELIELGKQHKKTIAEIMFENERTLANDREIELKIDGIWQAMNRCIESGITSQGTLPGKLKVERRAHEIYKKLKQETSEGFKDPLKPLDWVNLYALAVNEENAAGSVVVTAPTNGAAGVIPATIRYYLKFCHGREQGVREFLLTAGAIGILYKKNASISGAEVGCQGEVGVACSMAAAGLTAALGGSNLQIEQAAEIGMEHNLGLTCDPIGGLVQIPCIERNAMGAVKAINASRIALAGSGEHHVSLDSVIKTMWETGADMQTKYKETSRGGLAVNVIEC